MLLDDVIAESGDDLVQLDLDFVVVKREDRRGVVDHAPVVPQVDGVLGAVDRVVSVVGHLVVDARQLLHERGHKRRPLLATRVVCSACRYNCCRR